MKLRYKRPGEDQSILLAHPIGNDAVHLEAASPSLHFGSAVAEFGLQRVVTVAAGSGAG